MVDAVKQEDVENGKKFLIVTKCGKLGGISPDGVMLPGLKNMSLSKFTVCRCEVGSRLSLRYVDSDGRITIGTTASVITQIFLLG